MKSRRIIILIGVLFLVNENECEDIFNIKSVDDLKAYALN